MLGPDENNRMLDGFDGVFCSFVHTIQFGRAGHFAAVAASAGAGAINFN